MHCEPLISRATVPRPDILTYQFHISSRCIRFLTRSIYTIYYRHGGFLFCLAFVTSTLSLVQGITSTCQSVTVMKGSATSLTCKFGDDLRKFKKTVYLDHLQVNNSKHALVAQCRWASNGYNCNSMSGYILTGNVTDTLRVNITNVDETNVGEYWCEIFGSDPHDRTSCEVYLLGNSNITREPTSPNSGKEIGISNITTETTLLNIGKEMDKGDKRALAITFGILIPVTVCVVVALIVFIRSKRNSSGGSHHSTVCSGTNHEEDSNHENESL